MIDAALVALAGVSILGNIVQYARGRSRRRPGPAASIDLDQFPAYIPRK